MTESHNIPELQDLEPLDAGAPAPGAPAQATVEEATLQALRSGLPPPAFNLRCTDKTYYRFLLCGLLIMIGCLMPFSADLQQVGWKTMSGAIFLVIGLGMVWTWWGAIHNNRSTAASLKWLLLCFLPFAAQVMNLMNYDAAAALATAKAAGHLPGDAAVASWQTLFNDMFTALGKSAEAPPAAMRVENFFRCFGTGKIFVFLGATFAELFFILGIVGGAKQNKQMKMARMAQAAERKRR
jgi:hypothetical protein